MTRISFFLASGLFVALLSGCHHDQVVGSGNRQTQKRDVREFTSISTQGAFEIEFTAQKPVSLEIEGDDNILPLISTEVSNNVLVIKSTRGFSASSIKIRVTAQNLEGLSVAGAGTITVNGLKNDKFEIDADGAPTITVAGESAMVDIEANGAGKIDAHRLRAGRAVVDSKGVADIHVYANDQLDITVSGPSHVVYEGSAKVTKTIHGPGSIEKKESGPS